MRRVFLLLAFVGCSEPETLLPATEPTSTIAPVDVTIFPTPAEWSVTPTPMINPPVTGECPGEPPIIPLDVLLAGWGL